MVKPIQKHSKESFKHGRFRLRRRSVLGWMVLSGWRDHSFGSIFLSTDAAVVLRVVAEAMEEAVDAGEVADVEVALEAKQVKGAGGQDRLAVAINNALLRGSSMLPFSGTSQTCEYLTLITGRT
jgi:O-glycosyl hydrolase